ncbi:MAG: succinylglutamate desuccinylase/aspartoacylase family protein [Candidatus Latescibacterota bacterium]|nr:succinylglutamate desuccinylase/aspartoacylase family protein [Candidatus Latescibacterota bacterium]
MSDLLEVEHLKAKPGTAERGYIAITEMRDGTPTQIPVVLVNGSCEGPTLYLQAISDGDELNGLGVIRRVLGRIDPARLCGQVIAVPIVNVHALHAHQAFSPVDNKKMNRCFPGRRDGTSSQRIAYWLFQNAVLQSDYVVDLHQGGIRPMIDEVRVRVDRRKRIHRACLEMARIFGIGYILDVRGPEGQLARSAPDEGIPTIDPELGGCIGWDEGSILKGVTGVENLMKHHGMVSGKPNIPHRQVVVDGFLSLLSNRGGIIDYRAELYDVLQKDDPVADITDPFGEVLETLVASEESVMWSKALRPMVATGECVATLGKNIRHV